MDFVIPWEAIVQQLVETLETSKKYKKPTYILHYPFQKPYVTFILTFT